MAQLFFPANEKEKKALIRWACDILPRAGEIEPAMCEVIGVLDPTRERLRAVAIYHEYRKAYDQIELTAASKTPRWCSRGAMQALLHYPFEQLGCRKLICMIEGTNEPATRFAGKAGMRREGIIRHHFGHKAHAHFYSMMAHEYRRSPWAARVDAMEPV